MSCIKPRNANQNDNMLPFKTHYIIKVNVNYNMPSQWGCGEIGRII